MIRLTKNTESGYEWSDFVKEVEEMDPNEIELSKLSFIGICEEFCGITFENNSRILQNFYYRPFLCKVVRCLIMSLLK